MKSCRLAIAFRLSFALGCCLFLHPMVLAQSTTPNPLAPVLAPVFPAGMQRGTTMELVLTGKNLAAPTGVWTTFPCKIDFPKDKKNGQNPVTLRVRLTVPKTASLGWHGLRLATEQGMSNPRMFCLDELPQVNETGNNHSRKTAQKISVPCAVAGRVDNLSRDFFRFLVKKNQQMSFAVQGRRLGGPLDPQLTIWSLATGRQVATVSDTLGLQSDCRVTHTFSEAGEYIVGIKDVLNRGGGDYVYRLRIGDFPCVQTPIPLAARRGSKLNVRFSGPHGAHTAPQAVAIPQNDEREVMWLTPAGRIPGWPVALFLTDLPELVEQEPNDAPQANKLPVPGAVTGRLQKYADTDRYRFPAKKGQKLILQAHTLEMFSPTYVYMTVKDLKGKELSKSNPAAAHPADGRITFTPPADGEYVAEVQHVNSIGDEFQVYRLSITPPQPDFAVSLDLDRWDIPQSQTRVLPLKIKRTGYAGRIDIRVDCKNPGVTGNVTVAKNAKTANLFLQCKEDAPVGPSHMRLRATAKINGQTVTRWVNAREAVQTSLGGVLFSPPHLHTELAVAVTPRPPFTLTVNFAPSEGVPGLKTTATVTVQRTPPFDGPIAITPAGFPGKVKLPKIKPIVKGQTKTTFSVVLDKKSPLGKHIIVVTGKRKINGRDRISYAAPATLVIGRPFALKVEPRVLTLKRGATATVKISALRKGGYQGPINLQARNLPKGVTAKLVNFAKGKTESEIVLSAAKTAALGESRVVNILGTAMAASNQQQASPYFTIRIQK